MSETICFFFWALPFQEIFSLFLPETAFSWLQYCGHSLGEGSSWATAWPTGYSAIWFFANTFFLSPLCLIYTPPFCSSYYLSSRGQDTPEISHPKCQSFPCSPDFNNSPSSAFAYDDLQGPGHSDSVGPWSFLHTGLHEHITVYLAVG